jgi:phage baseplate assembly protein W
MAKNEMFSDIDIELSQQTDGDVLKDIEHEAIKNSIRNIVTTSKGTRRMLPEFGANLEEILFEPMDEHTARRIGSIILDEIAKWEYRVIIDNIDVTGNIDKMQYNITISYHIKGLGQLGGGIVKLILKQT